MTFWTPFCWFQEFPSQLGKFGLETTQMILCVFVFLSLRVLILDFLYLLDDTHFWKRIREIIIFLTNAGQKVTPQDFLLIKTQEMRKRPSIRQKNYSALTFTLTSFTGWAVKNGIVLTNMNTEVANIT